MQLLFHPDAPSESVDALLYMEERRPTLSLRTPDRIATTGGRARLGHRPALH